MPLCGSGPAENGKGVEGDKLIIKPDIDMKIQLLSNEPCREDGKPSF
jgi:hypothetical protein